MTDIFIIVITLTITIIIIIMIAIKSGKLGWVEVGSLGVLANKHCSTFSCCTRHHCNQPSSSLSLFLRLWSRHFTLKLTPTITPNDKCLKKQSLKRPEKRYSGSRGKFHNKIKIRHFWDTLYTHLCLHSNYKLVQQQRPTLGSSRRPTSDKKGCLHNLCTWCTSQNLA